MKIFTKDQIQAVVQQTVACEGLKLIDMIERAGLGIAQEIAARYDAARPVVVFAGWGNNGADALAAASALLDMGYDLRIYLFNIGGTRLSPECEACRNTLMAKHPDANLTEVIKNFMPPELDERHIVIDGIFGTGLASQMPAGFSMLIRNINQSGATIVAIDLPSGLFPDWNTNPINNNIFHASLTLAIQFPHLAFFFDENAELVGEWKTIDVGMSRKAIRETPYTFYLVTKRDARTVLRPRWPEASKAEYGSALIVAGSYGMMGAAVLSTRACLRAGVGKVTCYAPACGMTVLQSAVPAAMYIADPCDTAITEITLKHDYHAVAIGPGLGTADDTISALESFLIVANANRRPVVLDADALNCISIRPTLLSHIPVLSVLTPHAGEFDRLFGDQPSTEARLRKAIEVAAYYNVVILLKGRYTCVVRPDGKVHINSSGSPALATAGSGDCLTGIIAALIAQGYVTETAATLGAYVHGVAGEICEQQHGAYGTIADDIALATALALKKILEQ